MNTRKERMKKLGIDILLEILGLIVLYLILSYAQTQFSDTRQNANSMAKIELAMHRMDLHTQEANGASKNSIFSMMIKISFHPVPVPHRTLRMNLNLVNC